MSQRYIFEVKKGRKVYQCEFCEEKIAIGEFHLLQVAYNPKNAVFFNYRFHGNCAFPMMEERHRVAREFSGRPRLNLDLTEEQLHRRRLLQKYIIRARSNIIKGTRVRQEMINLLDYMEEMKELTGKAPNPFKDPASGNKHPGTELQKALSYHFPGMPVTNRIELFAGIKDKYLT